MQAPLLRSSRDRSSRWEQLRNPKYGGCWPRSTGQWRRIHYLPVLWVHMWLKPEPGQFTVIPGALCNLQIKGRCTFAAKVGDLSIRLAAKMLPCAWGQHTAGWSPQCCPERYFISMFWRPNEYEPGIGEGSGNGMRLKLLLQWRGWCSPPFLPLPGPGISLITLTPHGPGCQWCWAAIKKQLNTKVRKGK